MTVSLVKLVIVPSLVGLWAVGQALARRRTVGDETKRRVRDRRLPRRRSAVVQRRLPSAAAP